VVSSEPACRDAGRESVLSIHIFINQVFHFIADDSLFNL
jgi:hypothetical protein